ARELAATRDDREAAAGAGDVLGHERSALALRTETVVLERDEDGERVAVVELDHVDVAAREPGHRERGLVRQCRTRGERVRRVAAEVTLRHAADPDGRLPALP